MPRKANTKELDVVGNLDLNLVNADNVKFCLESKNQHQFYLKPPNCGSIEDTVYLHYVNNRLEYDTLKNVQREGLKQAKGQSRINEIRTKVCDKQTIKLRHNFIDVNHFIRECRDKEQVARTKIAEECKTQDELVEQSATSKLSLDVLYKFRETLRDTAAEYEPYEQIARDVLPKVNKFETVQQLMTNCDAIMMAYVEIGKQQSETMTEIERIVNEIKAIAKDSALKVFGLKTQLNELNRMYVEERMKCLFWESKIGKIKGFLRDHDLQKDVVYNNILQLYYQLCLRKNESPNMRNYTLSQGLYYIMEEVDFLKILLHKLGAI